MSRSLFQISDLSLSFGPQVLFDGLAFSLHEGDHAALIGENGCGKSTLLNMIKKEMGERATLLTQEVAISDLKMTPRTFLQNELLELRKEMEGLEQDLEDPNKLALWGDLHAQFEEMGGYAVTSLETIANGLHFAHLLDQPMKKMSSGERVRVALGKVLLEDRDLLLLDEPTNHLDQEMIEWLQNYIKKWKKAVLIVSHNRTFLNAVTDHIIELSEGKLHFFRGNYDAYLKEREQRTQKKIEAFEAQEEAKKELRKALRALSFSRKKAPPPKDRNVMAYDRRGEEHQRSLSRKLSELKKRLEEIESHPLQHPKPKTIKGLHFSSGEGKLSIPIELDRTWVLKRGDRIIITGRNGAGKTTLLRKIISQIPSKVIIGYLDQEGEEVPLDKTPLEFFWESFNLEEEGVRREMHKAGLKGEDLLKRPFHSLSIGQKKRLMLLSLVLSKPDILLLDEPTNHLDFLTMEALEKALIEFEGVVITASHDSMFVQKVATRVWKVEKGVLGEGPSV